MKSCIHLLPSFLPKIGPRAASFSARSAARHLFCLLLPLLGAGHVWVVYASEKPSQPATPPAPKTIMETSSIAPEQPQAPVTLTDEQWKARLTPEQYRILRKAGTERANGPVYNEFKKQGAGTYYCAGCNAELFSSNEKFDSRCGWPSFYDPANAKNVKLDVDYHLGYARTEVRCAVCDGHLGHVFKGEGFDTPTDKRYCINGTVLKFVPAPPAPSSNNTSSTPATPAPPDTK